MAKKFDPKAKARRQKIIAAVLGVVLLGVLAYQGPTILGMFGGGSSTVQSEPAPATPAAPAAPAGAPASPATPAPAAGSAQLVDSDVAPAPATGQLVTFDRFESKDPFVQQVGKNDGTAAPAAPETEAPTPGAASKPKSKPTAQGAPAAAKNAEITVNGKESTASIGGTFPNNDPIFRLTALTGRTAKIAIVGGTYASGSQTITLQQGGKPVTLMNTSDGTTYVLRLLSAT